MRPLLRLMAGLAAALGLAGAVQAAPAMWAVKDADTTIYLFGAMHVLEPNVTWRTPLFDAAYARSSAIWFETDVTALSDKAKMAEIVNAYGVDADHPLSAKLTEQDRAALNARLVAAGVSPERMERMKPWMASLILTVLPIHAQGFDPKAGADAVVNRSAAADAKTVHAFETPEAQARFLADLPEPVQVQLLEDGLREDQRPLGQMKAVQAAWLAGDIVTLGPMLLAEMKAERPALYDVLIRRRNRAWSDVIATEMSHPGVQMVDVGALHMVGDDGLPALLIARGFKVERVQ
jgi:uncharacterized protein YbaP (TraB family)